MGSIRAPSGGLGATINMSAIPAEESVGFMTANEFNDHFGSEMRPDTVKITSVMKVQRPLPGKNNLAASSRKGKV